jgi:hypothetical protein
VGWGIPQFTFQTRNVKNWVKTGLDKKFQPISNLTNAAEDFIRTEESGGELQILPKREGLLAIWLQPQVHPIPYIELTLRTVFVNLSFHAVLSCLKMFL